jgi:hypothetical protein
MVFAIGADEETESHPNEGFFRVRAALGQEGNLGSFRITDAKGKTAYSLQVFPTGDTQVVQRSEVRNVDLGWSLLCDSFNLAARGAGRISADDNLDIKSGGSISAVSNGRLSLRAVGGNASLRSLRSVNINSGNTMSITARGPLLPILGPLTRSMDVVATNGSVSFDVGSPLAGDLQATFSGFHVSVNSAGGSIRFSTGLVGGGGFVVDTYTPASVKIGGPSLAPHPSPFDPGLFSAVLYEPLLGLLNQMAAAFDSHFHVTEVGPSLPPTVPPAPFPTPVQSIAVGAAAPLMISKFVRFGG